MSVPLPALLLGVAGLLPFVAGALAAHGMMPGISNPITGLLILQTYGAAILAFMGGCLWGFAAEARRRDWQPYVYSVIPALWAASATLFPGIPGFGAPPALATLASGFVVLLAVDLLFRGWGLGPRWWLSLRLPLSAGVLVCLGAGLAA
ncbi:MAG: DUF3429 domain-containing protein [Pseudomonadota bacterium]